MFIWCSLASSRSSFFACEGLTIWCHHSPAQYRLPLISTIRASVFCCELIFSLCPYGSVGHDRGDEHHDDVAPLASFALAAQQPEVRVTHALPGRVVHRLVKAGKHQGLARTQAHALAEDPVVDFRHFDLVATRFGRLHPRERG